MKTLTKIKGEAYDLVESIENGEYFKNSFTTGFKILDRKVGRMRPGEMWVIGGYNGAGKSYWLINMLDGLLAENPKANILVCSSEMDERRYMLRWACKRVGCWVKDLEMNPQEWGGKVKQELKNITENHWNNVHIAGYAREFSEVIELAGNGEWDIVFIDFLQNLIMDGVYSESEKMPIMATDISNMLQKTGTVGVVLSQMNNQAMTKDFQRNAHALTGLSYGKELNHFAQTTMILGRTWNENGETLPTVLVDIKKARSGQTGHSEFEIERGYNVCSAPPSRLKEIYLKNGMEV